MSASAPAKSLDISQVASFCVSLQVLVALWTIVLLFSCVAGNCWLRWCRRSKAVRQGPKRRARNGVGSRLDDAVRHAVLGANVLVACTRLAWLRDPRGWEGRYGVETWQLLLRCPQCVLLGAWLVVILHWRTVASFRSRGGLSRALTWTPKQSVRITLALTATLSALVVTGVVVSNNATTYGAGAQRVATRVVSGAIGVYAGAFVIAAWFVGCRALRLYEPRPSQTMLKRFSIVARESEEVGGAGDDAVQLKRWQIRCSLLTATPCALGLLALAVWRGAPGSVAKSNAVAFELYFEATHAIEWLLAMIIIFTVMPLNKVAMFARFTECCCCCCRRHSCRCCCGCSPLAPQEKNAAPLSAPDSWQRRQTEMKVGVIVEEEVNAEASNSDVDMSRRERSGARMSVVRAVNPTATTRATAQAAAHKATMKSRFPSTRHLPSSKSRARNAPVHTVHTVDAL